ncbi:hypothetical protein SAMN06265222_11416 [Neorhodopirellula lusitana]|uniref:NADH-ubiquinone oxidoreductase n=1 Tax=Neorhodopirellula lusitana TaxID=445327 RepID=A0ABY1QGZ3_9BACT|nr:hypothetical protein [Neorhodopirellula lusitana]SMP71284.1 hypothetical protein SAMN06265222_11416 [Neorhodopirellula lusitana]
MPQIDAEGPPQHTMLETSGVWPFVSRRVHSEHGRVHVWTSRQHRKGLSRLDIPRIESFFAAQSLNTWIGVVFAIGASCFVVASLMSLFPGLAELSVLGSHIDAVYFAGSIPFTIAAWLQLFQAANPNATLSGRTARRRVWFGWYPKEIGWLSCALQFAGTVLFNFNTFDAMSPSLNWWQENLVVWVPDLAGSILFLASGYLAFIEANHKHWAFHPRSLSWWIVFINLLGCVGFMISACFAFTLPSESNNLSVNISTAWTLQGAICFLAGAVLMPFESAESA